MFDVILYDVEGEICGMCERGLPQCAGDVIGYHTAEEVLAMVDESEGSNDEPSDIDDDCGFDPYEGCYTYDC